MLKRIEVNSLINADFEMIESLNTFKNKQYDRINDLIM